MNALMENEHSTSKRIVLILAGVFAIALIAAAFWGNRLTSQGALAGQSKILVVAGNGNGNRDSMQAGGQAAQQLIPVTGADGLLSQPSLNPYLVVGGQPVDDHYPVLSSAYLVVGGQPVDDHFPALSGAYLTVVGKYHDR
jgi:hypothetical protein